MNKSVIFSVLIGALFLSGSMKLIAADRATPAEAQAMLKKAIAYYKLVGRKRALDDFTAKKPPFGDRDLYVVCIDHDGTVVANGGFPQNVGTPADALTDVNDEGVGKAAWEAVAQNGEGAVRYRWVDPLTHDLKTKTTFFAKVGDDVCGVGVYVNR